MSPTIVLNGEECSVDEGTSLGTIVEREVGEEADHVAVALNDEIISRGRWDETTIEAGDEIEVVQPIQGGAGLSFST